MPDRIGAATMAPSPAPPSGNDTICPECGQLHRPGTPCRPRYAGGV